MRVCTFYSYKGGVGRTLLLAATARALAARGKRVLTLDLDLEAPGLHHKLGVTGERGLVDLVARYQRFEPPPDDLAAWCVPVPGTDGRLALLPAGAAPTGAYWRALRDVDWSGMISHGEGTRFFMWLVETLEKVWKPDHLLIDARTGVTEMGVAAVGLFADDLVALTTNTPESRGGTRAVLRAAQGARVATERDLRVLVIAARVPLGLTPDAEAGLTQDLSRFLREPADPLTHTPAIDRVLVVHHDDAVLSDESVVFGPRQLAGRAELARVAAWTAGEDPGADAFRLDGDEAAARQSALDAQRAVVASWRRAADDEVFGADRGLRLALEGLARLASAAGDHPGALAAVADLEAAGGDAAALRAQVLLAAGEGEGSLAAELRAEVVRRARDLTWLGRRLHREVGVDSEAVVEVEVEHGVAVMPLRDALERAPRRWLLEGEPGCGKTTLLRRLVIDLAADQALLPVLLPADVARRHHDPVDAIVAHYGPRSQAPAARARAEGRLVLLIDGMDEAAGDRGALGAALNRLVAAAPGCRVVVATRPLGRAELAGFGTLTVRPLDPPARRALLTGLGLSDADATAVLDHLRGDTTRLGGFARNPLLLTLVGLLRRAGRTLPRRRSDLYEEVITLRLHPDEVNPDAAPLPDADRVRRALEDAALELHTREDESWRGDALARATGLTEAELREVARRTELLVPTGRVWSMPHRTLREYLAACAVARRVGEQAGFRDTLIDRAVADPGRWGEVLALYAAMPKAGEPLVQALVRRGAAAQGLLWKALGDAEGLKAATVLAAIGLAGGRDAWKSRAPVLLDLPSLLGGRLDLAVGVARQLAEHLVHGADAWHLRRLLGQIASGEVSGAVGDDTTIERVRAEAAEEHASCLVRPAVRGPAARDRARRLIEPEWRPIPPGETAYGDDLRRVSVPTGFELMRVPVTNRMFALFDPEHRFDMGEEDHPVTDVTWFEAAAFAAWLGDDVRLPREVEWEHACRAGTRTKYWSGNTEADLAAVGWYAGNSGYRTHAVTDLPSPRAGTHPYGLLHMHGNVSEWTADTPRSTFAAAQPGAGVQRVHRGGGFADGTAGVRVAGSWWDRSSYSRDDLGFRLARGVPGPVSARVLDS